MRGALGVSRRDFLFTVSAAATTLLALQGCLRRLEARSRAARYEVPPEAKTRPDAARSALAGDEFVFDVQGHHLEYDLMQRYTGEPYFGAVFPQVNCGEDDPRACFRPGGLPRGVLPEERHQHGDPVGAADRTQGQPAVGGDHGGDAPYRRAGLRLGIGASARPGAAQLRARSTTTSTRWRRTRPGIRSRPGRSSPTSPTRSGTPATRGGWTTPIRVSRAGWPRVHREGSRARRSRRSAPTRASAPEARTHHLRTWAGGRADFPDVNFIVYHSGFERTGSPEGPYTPSDCGHRHQPADLRDEAARA